MLDVSAEGIYWRPRGLDFPVIQPTPSAGFPLNGASQGISHGFAPGYRLTVRWQNLRMSWLDLQAHENYSTQSPGILAQAGPSAVTGTAEASSAVSSTRLQILGMDFLQLISANSAQTFYALAGLRYARIFHATQILYFNNNKQVSDDQQYRIVNNMMGVRVGLESHYKVRQTLSVDGSVALSLLHGNSQNNATEITPFVPNNTVNKTGAVYNTVAPALEVGLKLTYTPIESFDAWMGFDLLQFSEGVIKQTYSGASSGPAQQTRMNISFLGPSLGLLWRFS